MGKLKKAALIILVVLLVAAAGVGGLTYYYYDKYVDIEQVYPGISIGSMNVGGMTREQEQEKIDAYITSVQNETLTLQAGEKTQSLPLKDLGYTCANPEVTQEAYDYGKKGNFIDRIRMVYELTRKPKNYDIKFTYDEKLAREKILAIEKSYLAKKKDATITRKNGKFVITDEVNGMDMDLDKNLEGVIAMLSSGNWDQKSMTYQFEYKEDKAKHTKAELSVIKDKLGTFTTSYGGSPGGRCTNVANGARLINGTLLYPGDSFSVHDAVTPFTYDNGYRLAGSYENGTTVQTYGGGICQVSTTLYNAVLRAELEVLERSNHSMTVHYVELSEDAAISGEEKDFRFKNSLENPIYIVGSTDSEDETITFTIYGKEYRPKDRKIEFVSETTGTRAPSEKIIKDKTLPVGKKIVEKQGHTGYTARLWKVIHEKGKEDKWIQVNSSDYMSTPREVRVGTKKKQKKTDKKTTKATKTTKKTATKKKKK